jgi:hypothetical protein
LFIAIRILIFLTTRNPNAEIIRDLHAIVGMDYLLVKSGNFQNGYPLYRCYLKNKVTGALTQLYGEVFMKDGVLAYATDFPIISRTEGSENTIRENTRGTISPARRRQLLSTKRLASLTKSFKNFSTKSEIDDKIKAEFTEKEIETFNQINDFVAGGMKLPLKISKDITKGEHELAIKNKARVMKPLGLEEKVNSPASLQVMKAVKTQPPILSSTKDLDPIFVMKPNYVVYWDLEAFTKGELFFVYAIGFSAFTYHYDGWGRGLKRYPNLLASTEFIQPPVGWNMDLLSYDDVTKLKSDLFKRFLTKSIIRILEENPKPGKILFIAHNFSGYDALFFTKFLAREGDFTIAGHTFLFKRVVPFSSGRSTWYSITITSTNKLTLKFTCSYLLTNIALTTLYKRIKGLETTKDTFPHDIVSQVYLENKLHTIPKPDLNLEGLIGYPIWGEKARKWLNSNQTKTYHDYFKEYLLQDINMLRRSIHVFFNKLTVLFTNEDKGQLGPSHDVFDLLTVGGTGMKLFKRRFYNEYEYPLRNIPITTPEYLFLGETYFGGNTTIFSTGAEEMMMDNPPTIYHYDLPGAYAQAILRPLPYGRPIIHLINIPLGPAERKQILLEIQEMGRIFFCKVQVDVSDQMDAFPPLPFRYEYNAGRKGIIFPIGRWRGYYNSVELETLILGENCSFRIIRGNLYRYPSARHLEAYRTYISGKKHEAEVRGDKGERTLMKLINNSLYGKFASRVGGKKTELVTKEKKEYILNNFKVIEETFVGINRRVITYEQERGKKFRLQRAKMLEDAQLQMGNYLAERKKKYNRSQEHKFGNVRISRCITRYTRQDLFKLAWELKAQGAKIFYCDTDSLFFTCGEFKYGDYAGFTLNKERIREYRKYIFLAPKIYYIVEERGKVTSRMKGMRKDNKDNMTFNSLLSHVINNTEVATTNNIKFSTPKNLEGKEVTYISKNFTWNTKIEMKRIFKDDVITLKGEDAE